MDTRTRTDEASTDISETNSERSLMITETSSPFRSIFSHNGKVATTTAVLEESDKQILEWAGKLELESMELRENSGKLIKVLNDNSKTLCKSLSKFNQLLEQDTATNGNVKKLINDLGAQMEAQLGKLSASSPPKSDARPHTAKPDPGYRQALVDELSRYNSKITRHVTNKQHETEKSMRCTQEMLFNVGSQMEDVQKVLVSLSKDMHALQARQASLETAFRERAAHVCDPQDVAASLNGTTLLHDSDDDHHKRSTPPPRTMVTRSMKRDRSTSPTVSTSQDDNDDDDNDGDDGDGPGRQLKRAARTIIPWEELRPDTLESEL